MAGLGARFTDYGFTINKYLLPIDNKKTPMISKALTTLVSDLSDTSTCMFIFITKNDAEGIVRKVLVDICTDNGYHNYVIHDIGVLTDGPASTVYEIRDIVRDMGLENVDMIISNSDQILDFSLTRFLNVCKKYDGTVLVYNPDYKLEIGSTDKHSFVKYDCDDGDDCDGCGDGGDDCVREVTDISEKIVLSTTALVGVHHFSSYKLFLESYTEMVSRNLRAPNGEFYLSLVYKIMLMKNLKVGTCKLKDNEHYYPVGEPNDYFDYLYKHSDCTKEQIESFRPMPSAS